MANTEWMPPQSNDAEMAVLGAMLIEKDAILKALGILEPKDFYNDVHRKIFDVIKNLFAENISVDIITVGSKLQQDLQFQNAGGAVYLTKLIDAVQTAANVEFYANIVKEKALLRLLLNTCTNIQEGIWKEKEKAETLIDNAQSKLYGIVAHKKSNDFKSAGSLIRHTLKNIEKLHSDKTDIPGLKTGFTAFDMKTAGLHPANLIIIAARPSMGKTAFALNIAENVAINDRKAVAIFSLEMSQEELMMRLSSSIARINGHDLRKGKIKNADEWSRLGEAGAKISKAPLYILDSNDLTVFDMRTKARKLALELKSKGEELSLIIVDYLQIMRGCGQGNNRNEELAEISRGLKGLAKDLHVPVIALSQLSRKTEDRGRKNNKPQLSDLRESGAIEQDADIVTFIYREGYYNRYDPDVANSAELIIAKQRNGPIGEIPLIFEGEYAKFSNASFGRKD